MPIQPLPDVAIAVDVVFAPVGIQPQQIGIVRGICPEAILTVISEAAVLMHPAIGRQAAPIFQDTPI